MKLLGQRWRFQLENSEVFVDNAFSLLGWAQERLVVNGDPVQQAGQWFAFRRSFAEDWLTATGDGVLEIRMRSKINGVDCKVVLNGKEIEPDGFYEATWKGTLSWPLEGDWQEVEKLTFGNKV